jgi:hypothetical protein
MISKSSDRLKAGADALFSVGSKPEVTTQKPEVVSSESEVVSSEPGIANNNSEVASSKPDVASNVLGITNSESEIASSNTLVTTKETEIVSSGSERAISESVVATDGIDIDKLDAAMRSYYEDPRVTVYSDVGGAILSYLYRTHAIESISAEGAKAMETELKRKNPEVWKAIQRKLKTEDKWKPILEKRGKRKRRT